jgi:hypothetical protein
MLFSLKSAALSIKFSRGMALYCAIGRTFEKLKPINKKNDKNFE